MSASTPAVGTDVSRTARTAGAPRRTGASSTRTAERPAQAAARRRGHLVTLAFLSPGLVGLLLFFGYPLVSNVVYSFERYDLINRARWVGLTNYRFLVHDTQIRVAIRNTLWFVVISVPVQLLFALGVALVLARVRSGAGVYRTLFYLPTLLPPVAATLAIAFVLDPGTGPVDAILHALHLPQPLWFDDPHWSKPSLVLLSLWAVGNTIVILLAGVLDVPASLTEAAMLDGAGSWARLRHITLPTISPVLLFSAVTGVIAAMQTFTEPYVVSTIVASGSGLSAKNIGYPNGSTLFYTEQLYQQGFRYFNMGYAAALAIVLLVATLVVALAIVRLTRDAVHTEGD